MNQAIPHDQTIGAAASAPMLVVDADAHVTEPADLFSTWIEPEFRARAPRIVGDARGKPWMGYRLEFETLGLAHAGAVELPPPPPEVRGFTPADRLADMDAEGIDVALLYPSLALGLGHIRDPELAAASYRAYNNWLHDYCRADARRLVPIAALPMQDIGEATREARRVAEQLGMRGVVIRPNPHAGRRLDHPALDPLWATLAELQLPVAIHEGTTSTLETIGGDRYANDPFRLHMVSHVMEEMLACMDMIVGGVLDRFASLRVVFLESGGSWIVPWLRRMDHMSARAGDWRPKLNLRPSEYFARQCWISFDPDEPLFAETIALLGAERILWASDYPHFDGTFPGAASTVRARLDGLPLADQARVLGVNAALLYGLSVEP